MLGGMILTTGRSTIQRTDSCPAWSYTAGVEKVDCADDGALRRYVTGPGAVACQPRCYRDATAEQWGSNTWAAAEAIDGK